MDKKNEVRELLKEESEQFKNGLQIICECMKLNENIPLEIWFSVFSHIIACACHECGMPYDEFCERIEKVKWASKLVWLCDNELQIDEET